MDILTTSMLATVALFGPPDEGLWTFTATSGGENFSWTSPSGITPSGSHYEMNYHVTAATVMVSYIGIDFGPIDVLDMFPEDVIDTWRSSAGPAPLDFGWIHVEAPSGQDPPAIEYDWIIELDAKGHAVFRMENVSAGQIEYDLGWPWGSVTVNIESGSITADLWTASVSPPCYGDISGDNMVNVTDLLEVIANWGYCHLCPADVNNDSVVDVTDLLIIVAEWGPCSK